MKISLFVSEAKWIVFILSMLNTADARIVKREALEADIIKPLFDALQPKSIIPLPVPEKTFSEVDKTANLLYCSLCMFLAEYLMVQVRENADMEIQAVEICSQNYGTKEQCDGFVNAQLKGLFNVLNTTSDINVENICASLINCIQSPVTWTFSLPGNELKDARRAHHREGRLADNSLKLVHVTDVHVDPEYDGEVIGECFLNICCKARRNLKSNATSLRTQMLGEWGDYHACGLPRKTVEHLLCEHINKTHRDVDVLIWTGDIPGHGSWLLNRQQNIQMINDTLNLVKKCLPEVIVIPAIGNHEAYPVNDFEPGEQTKLLYSDLVKMWSDWLPEDAQKQALNGGFYTVQIRKGLRAIVLNTNYCYKYNWWNHVKIIDPMNQLEWLALQLDAAEKADEDVYVVSHISPGSPSCLPTWSHYYFKLLERYSTTIVAQFYGHEHTDSFHVFFGNGTEGRMPIGVGLIGPSVTTLNGNNAGYRVYHTERMSNAINDIETYFMDINEANSNGKSVPPNWKFLYNLNKEFEFNPTSSEGWTTLIKRLGEDEKLFQKFYSYTHRKSKVFPDCGNTCKQKLLCGLQASDKTKDLPQECDFI
ncbi:unnamed protein product [Notodromas monacha]|uniref:Sphingomyelin phosphodiesterase n=1 Tax=Notodromas monacha TaxID=399045 RepID=A0A7R9G988_9CRUS|nr:unnamed protein product [Notodromas monacha]CAG0912352.1 unnamed protein product [Notodromas monacha]